MNVVGSGGRREIEGRARGKRESKRKERRDCTLMPIHCYHLRALGSYTF